MSNKSQAPLMPQLGQANSNSSLATILPLFETHMGKEGFSIHSVKAFMSDGRLLGEYIGMETKIGEISTDDLNKYLYWLKYERGKPCSDKTYARRITTIKVLYKWLIQSEILMVNAAAGVIQKSVTSPVPIIPTNDEVERALTVTEKWREHGKGGKKGEPDARPHMLLTLLLQTGIKKGEAMAIELDHIERDTPDPYLFVKYKKASLSEKERKLPLDETWFDVLDAYLAQYALPTHLFNCTARNLEYILRDVCREAELPDGLLSFENLRWTAAIRDLQRGVLEDTVRQKQGLSKVTWRERRKKLKKIAEAQNLNLFLAD